MKNMTSTKRLIKKRGSRAVVGACMNPTSNGVTSAVNTSAVDVAPSHHGMYRLLRGSIRQLRCLRSLRPASSTAESPIVVKPAWSDSVLRQAAPELRKASEAAAGVIVWAVVRDSRFEKP
jgi:hypothetical protein